MEQQSSGRARNVTIVIGAVAIALQWLCREILGAGHESVDVRRTPRIEDEALETGCRQGEQRTEHEQGEKQLPESPTASIPHARRLPPEAPGGLHAPRGRDTNIVIGPSVRILGSA